MYVIVIGDLRDDFTLVGPFKTREEAERYSRVRRRIIFVEHP